MMGEMMIMMVILIMLMLLMPKITKNHTNFLGAHLPCSKDFVFSPVSGHFPNSILNKNTKHQIAMMKRCCWWGGRSGHVLYWLARRRGTNNVLLEIKREKCQNNKLTQFCTTIQFLLSPPPPTPHPRYGATISILHRSEPPKIRKDKFTSSRCILGDGQRMKCNLTQNFNFQGPQKEYLGKLQYELKYDFNTQARIMIIMDFIAVFVCWDQKSGTPRMSQDVGSPQTCCIASHRLR